MVLSKYKKIFGITSTTKHSKPTIINEPKAAQPPVLVVRQLLELRHHAALKPLQRVVQRLLLAQTDLLGHGNACWLQVLVRPQINGECSFAIEAVVSSLDTS